MPLERHTDTLPKRVLDLAAEVKEDLELSELNLSQKGLACAGIKCKWQQIYCEEKSYLNSLLDEEGKLTEEYIKAHGRENVPRRASDKEAESNVKISELRKKIKEQRTVVEYMDGIVNITRGLNYDIRNCLDLVKLENG